MTTRETGAFELASRLLDHARSLGVTLGCAESCTGGMIAAALTSVPGSSDTFVGGVVSYWVEVKETLLGVDSQVIADHGVVSPETAAAMARGACKSLGCDYAVATTGIAGPGGAEPGKPVGTVCFAVAGPHGVTTSVTCLGKSRDEVRSIAVETALSLLDDALC